MQFSTYLYIKRHSITGKCYFGKTTQKDPVKYLGSGLHWKRHISLHGKEHIQTLWYKLYTDQAECTRVALLFSEQQDIVKSNLWLNLKPENGIDGATKGTKLSTEHKAKLSLANKGFIASKETRIKLSNAAKGKKLSAEHRAKISASHKGQSHSKEAKAKISASSKGKILSEETKTKLSISLKGKQRSAETKAKMSASFKGRILSEETKAKISAGRRKIIQSPELHR